MWRGPAVKLKDRKRRGLKGMCVRRQELPWVAPSSEMVVDCNRKRRERSPTSEMVVDRSRKRRERSATVASSRKRSPTVASDSRSERLRAVIEQFSSQINQPISPNIPDHRPKPEIVGFYGDKTKTKYTIKITKTMHKDALYPVQILIGIHPGEGDTENPRKEQSGVGQAVQSLIQCLEAENQLQLHIPENPTDHNSDGKQDQQDDLGKGETQIQDDDDSSSDEGCRYNYDYVYVDSSSSSSDDEGNQDDVEDCLDLTDHPLYLALAKQAEAVRDSDCEACDGPHYTYHCPYFTSIPPGAKYNTRKYEVICRCGTYCESSDSPCPFGCFQISSRRLISKESDGW